MQVAPDSRSRLQCASVLARLTRAPKFTGLLILRAEEEGLFSSNAVDAKRRSEDALGPSGRSTLLFLLIPLTAFRPLSAAPGSLTARGARGLGGRGGGKRLVPYPLSPAMQREGETALVCACRACVSCVRMWR